MAKKKAFVLRIDPDKLEAVQRWADDEFRSINGQLEWIVDKALLSAKRTKKNTNSKDNKNE